MAEATSLGEWMKRVRKELDLTQRSLAEQVGCATVTIQKIEEGKRRPSRHVAELLCRSLQIPPEDAERFLKLARASGPAKSPTLSDAAQAPVRTGNLPAPAAPFIGRVADIASLLKLIHDPAARLVTLVGPPGVGKTRLSIESASQAHSFPDGTWFIPLAPLQDTHLVIPTLAHALGMADVQLGELIGLLRNRSLLLLLDNCEHLLAAMVDVAKLLTACAGIKVMATSRVPLELYGETLFRVEPLALPCDGNVSDPFTLLQSDAVAMFVARAQAVSPGFALSTANAAQTVRLCRRLEGLPLAIELSVAGLYRYTVDELAQMIELTDGPLDGLTDSPRDFDPRHRSLRNAIAWSYQLLSEPERTVYRSLGVFHGEFSTQAVVGIAGETGTSSPESVTRILRELVRHSLLSERHAANADLRYSLLETIRSDAVKRCVQAGEMDRLAECHASWFLRQMSDIDWSGSGLENGLEQARTDQENLQAALSWFIVQGDAPRALQLCTALRNFWEYEGYQREGRDWLAQSLALPSPAPALLRAQALLDGCVLAFQQGDYATAQAWGEESLNLFLKAGRSSESALMMLTLGRVAIEQGQYATAEAWEEQSLALYHALDDRFGATGALLHLAESALGRGDDDAAQRLGEAGLALLTDSQGPVFWHALIHAVLAEVALRADQFGEAQMHLRESLDAGLAHHAIRPVTLALALAAALMCQLPGSPQDRARQAARLWGAVTEIRAVRGLSFSYGHTRRLDAYLAGARVALGQEAWLQAEQQGTQLSLDAAIGLAREALEPIGETITSVT